ncbi:hypothetical protein NB520_19700 [Vibrio antiquarius]|uniref:hypothetical protein n=1 Tax=Vibrio antiquarius (strain Ex25) TaxID=150340 RepID=UPI002659E7E0|nr:hypothetical protein [Vibrio antiquarius]MCR9628577.1 hypothetical protein [Vibrio antiquarius]MCR9633729.1 hypothetical protein [Vibrio antiquarius]HCG8219563.1 hypothetical protein [Vibrio parahaemolyticus]
MINIKKYNVLLILFSACFSFSSTAETWCEGKVTSIGVKKSGLVYASGPGGLPVVYLCNLQNKVNDVEVESCKAMYSSLLAAKAQNANVKITFSPDIESCSSVPSWAYADDLNWVITY